MLQVCAERLNELWPDAELQVLTTSPERLARFVPAATPFAAEGRYRWFREGSDRAGPPASPSWRMGRRGARAVLKLQRGLRRGAGPEARLFISAFLNADLFVISGRGGMTDVWLEDSLTLLAMFEMAASLGIPVAMFSQGLGPLEDPLLRRRARRVLPRLDLIAVREEREAGRLLADFDVPAGRVAFTGDDALEPAFLARPPRRSADSIGVGLRVTDYSGLSAGLEPLRRGLVEAAARLGTRLRAIPISVHPHESDGAFIAEVLGEEHHEQDTELACPRTAIERAGECRAVVAGSYHAAVFALAQGVPVVGIANSPYYASKLNGLAAQFGQACTVLSAGHGDLEQRLGPAIDDAWRMPEAERNAILEKVERMIAGSRRAYARLVDLPVQFSLS